MPSRKMRTAVNFFYGLDVEIGRNLGSRTTHPSCLSTLVGLLVFAQHCTAVLLALVWKRVAVQSASGCIVLPKSTYGPTKGG